MGLYSFKDSRDADRMLNRLKRLDGTVPYLKGGKEQAPQNPRTRLAELARRRVIPAGKMKL